MNSHSIGRVEASVVGGGHIAVEAASSPGEHLIRFRDRMFGKSPKRALSQQSPKCVCRCSMTRQNLMNRCSTSRCIVVIVCRSSFGTVLRGPLPPCPILVGPGSLGRQGTHMCVPHTLGKLSRPSTLEPFCGFHTQI